MAGLEVYTIRALQIAPFKSGGTILLNEARITPSGMETINGRIKDHEYVAVRRTPDNRGFHEHVTQRFHRDPKDKDKPAQSFRRLALIKPEDQDGLVLSWNHTSSIRTDIDFDPTKVLQVRVWDYEGPAIEDPKLSEWLSDLSGYDLLVARTVGPWNRMSRQNYIQNNNPLRAQDGYPIHPILLEDVKAISEKGGVEVPWNRFRPQVVLDGGPAWSLHNAFEGVIDGIKMKQPTPCGRCEMPRNNQNTGEMSPIKPLVYIRELRPQWVNKSGELLTIFGENWLPEGYVDVEVDVSKFVVTAHRNPPLEFRWAA